MKGQRRAGELLQQAAVSQHLPEVSAAGLAMVLNVGCSQRENGVKRDDICDGGRLSAGKMSRRRPFVAARSFFGTKR